VKEELMHLRGDWEDKRVEAAVREENRRNGVTTEESDSPRKRKVRVEVRLGLIWIVLGLFEVCDM
jgi:hypothetical protein